MAIELNRGKADIEVAPGMRLTKSQDGHWLHFKASNGKQAGLCLENMSSEIVRGALVQWATDTIESHK